MPTKMTISSGAAAADSDGDAICMQARRLRSIGNALFAAAQ
jgi:hypothetical protein